MIRSRAGCSIAAASALLLGCGSDADDVVGETFANLDQIRSGELDMRLLIGTGAAGGDVGFDLTGPFELPERAGELPTAEIAYTQRAGVESATVTLESTPDGASVEVDGATQELPADEAEQLTAASAPGGSPIELDVSDWLEDTSIEEAGSPDGESLDRISGRLNVPEAVNGLLELGEQLDIGGAGAVPLLGETAIDDGASGTIELTTSTEERLLRSLRLEIVLPLDEAARRALADSGADTTDQLEVTFDLTIIPRSV